MVFFWENNAIIIREYHALVIVFILYLEIVSTPFISIAIVALFLLGACASTSQLSCPAPEDVGLTKRFRGCPGVSAKKAESACMSNEDIAKHYPPKRLIERLKCME